MYKRLLPFLALLLCACASAPVRHEGVPTIKLAPSGLGASVSLAQRLTFERLDGDAIDTGAPDARGKQTLDAQLEIDASELRLAGFALGQRILTLRWDGHHLDAVRHPRLPASVDGEHVLRDVELAYWPVSAIQAALPDGWLVRDEGDTRSLSHLGTLALTVKYECQPRWAGRTTLENRLEGYRLRIESTSLATDNAS